MTEASESQQEKPVSHKRSHRNEQPTRNMETSPSLTAKLEKDPACSNEDTARPKTKQLRKKILDSLLTIQ